MCSMVVESGNWKTADALCSTINVNPERSSERHNPRELIPIRAFHPPFKLPSTWTEEEYNSLHSSFQLCVPARKVSCLASRFPNCLEIVRAQEDILHIRKGGWVRRDYSTGRDSTPPLSSRAQSRERRKGREGDRSRVFLSFFFPFYDRDCNSCPVFKGREGKMEKSRKGFVGNQK